MLDACRGARRLVILMAIATVMTGCARSIYGVSEEQWGRMSEPERESARQVHTERQRQFEAERAERMRQESIAAEQRRREAEETARRQREQVGAIHRGESGVYGDLIRVTISEGTMEFHGKRLPYQPVTFTLANHEQRKVTLQSLGGRSSRILEVPVSYTDGTFAFDTGRNPVRILYSPRWRTGEVHHSVSLGKHSVSDGQNLKIRVEIVPQAGVVTVASPVTGKDDRPPHSRPQPAPPPPPATHHAVAVKSVESRGMFPYDIQKYSVKNCINMSPFNEHTRALTGLKSFVIERDGYSVVLEALETRTSDPSRKRTVCRTDGTKCQEVTGWIFMKVNGTGMFLHPLEVKRIGFENGTTFLLSVIKINGRQEREGSGICWN